MAHYKVGDAIVSKTQSNNGDSGLITEIHGTGAARRFALLWDHGIVSACAARGIAAQPEAAQHSAAFPSPDPVAAILQPAHGANPDLSDTDDDSDSEFDAANPNDDG